MSDSNQPNASTSVAASPSDPSASAANSAPANATQGGREINKKVLHVGNVDLNVTEDMLMELFKVAGKVSSIKIFPDKNKQRASHGSATFNYAFIEYEDEAAAERAFGTLNKRALNRSELDIHWAFQNQSISAGDTETNGLYNVFVGDLASEVNDELLSRAFGVYGNMNEARVMWDMSTGRSRGYGFVSFSDKDSADRAINSMNGEWLGSRIIRCNWASQRNNNQGHHNNYNHQHHQHQHHHQHHQQNVNINGNGNGNGNGNANANYDYILRQTPNWQTTVYVGNLAPYSNSPELLNVLQSFGFIVDFKIQPDKGFAFVKYESHERAAMAITHLSNVQIHGRPIRVGWGKN